MSLHNDLACPSCHGLMEKGLVRSSGGLFWITDETTGKYVPNVGEYLLAENDASLTESLRFTTGRCRKCAVLLVKYVENPGLPED